MQRMNEPIRRHSQQLQKEVQGIIVVWTSVIFITSPSKLSFFSGNNGSAVSALWSRLLAAWLSTGSRPDEYLPLEDPREFLEGREGTLENGFHVQCHVFKLLCFTCINGVCVLCIYSDCDDILPCIVSIYCKITFASLSGENDGTLYYTTL